MYLFRFDQIITYLTSGGIVMIPLMMVSLVMWILIINRLIFFRQLYVKNMPRTHARELIQANQMPEKEYQGAIAVLVREFIKRRNHMDDPVNTHIIDESVMSLSNSLTHYLSAINILAGVAPLLGLLGTVIGMIVTFDVITVFGTGNAKAMAGGISEALITTQAGLLISIPGLYMSHFLDRRAQNLKHRIHSVGMYLKRYV